MAFIWWSWSEVTLIILGNKVRTFLLSKIQHLFSMQQFFWHVNFCLEIHWLRFNHTSRSQLALKSIAQDVYTPIAPRHLFLMFLYCCAFFKFEKKRPRGFSNYWSSWQVWIESLTVLRDPALVSFSVLWGSPRKVWNWKALKCHFQRSGPCCSKAD